MSSKQGKSVATMPVQKAKKHRRVMRDNIQGIVAPQIKRLTQRYGVTTISGLIYNEVRGLLKVMLENVVRNSTTLMEHYHRKTITGSIVEAAMEIQGVTICIGWRQTGKEGKLQTSSVANTYERDHPKEERNKNGDKIEHRKGKAGSKALLKIRHAQKNSEFAIFGYLPFSRLCREIAQDFKTDVQFSPRSIEMMRFYCETKLGRVIQNAYAITLASGRKKLFPKDIHVARSMQL